jgi:hypothetical protein
LNLNFLLAQRNRYLEGIDNGHMPPSGLLILIPTFLFILMFVFPQKPLKFWVEKVLEKWMSKVSNIHVR